MNRHRHDRIGNILLEALSDELLQLGDVNENVPSEGTRTAGPWTSGSFQTEIESTSPD